VPRKSAICGGSPNFLPFMFAFKLADCSQDPPNHRRLLVHTRLPQTGCYVMHGQRGRARVFLTCDDARMPSCLISCSHWSREEESDGTQDRGPLRLRGWGERTRARKRHFGKVVKMMGKFITRTLWDLRPFARELQQNFGNDICRFESSQPSQGVVSPRNCRGPGRWQAMTV